MKCVFVTTLVFATVSVQAKPYRNGLDFQSGMGRRIGMGYNGMGLDTDMGDGIMFENGMPSDTGMGFENGMGPAGMGFGNGMEFQNGMGGMGLQPSMGLGRGFGRQFANGQGFGSELVNKGASGFGNQAVRTAAGNNYHNVGAHHKKVTSINQAEESENHNIGSDSAYDSSAHAGRGFGNYQNGASQYGNQFNQGAENSYF